MSGMFDYCIFGEGFEFGEGFSTKGVKNFDNMFHGAKFPVGFNLGANLILLMLRAWKICLISVSCSMDLV